MIHPDSRTLEWMKQVAVRNINRFLKLEGEPVLVNVPSKADMLGDKLTAFAPNTSTLKISRN